VQTQDPIVLIGAGIGGLTAALALQRAGFRVRVFEQAPALGEVGAGLMVTPNSVRVLSHLGLEPVLERWGIEPEESIYRRFDTAEIIMRAPLRSRMLATYGARYFHIHRADLHAALAAAVQERDPAAITLGKSCVGVEETPAGAVARFADGSTAAGAAVIGSDGIRSQVRAALFGDGLPRFTGQIAWRGLVPAAGLPDTVTGPVSTVWIGPNRHIVQYRLRGGSIINYVAIVATDAWTEESWTTRSRVADVVAAFAGWHPDIVALLTATNPDHCFKWGLFDREPLARWTRGHVTLLGDAAHPMLPFKAQGSAMAIEDALVLARALQGAASVTAGLAAYEAARRERASGMVLESRSATALYQKLEGNKANERAAQLDHVYGYDAVTAHV
jgi:salicylate hydroxylase